MDVNWIGIDNKPVITLNLKIGCLKNCPDYSHALLVNIWPYITIPITSFAPINSIDNRGGLEIIDIVARNKIVKHQLESPMGDNRLWDASSNENKEEWLEEGRELAAISKYRCFNGANFIAWLFMGGDPITVRVMESGFELSEIAIEQLAFLRGVYYIETSGIEHHAFVGWFSEETLVIYTTYEDVWGFFITNFDRNSWIKNFLDFFKLDTHQQHTAWYNLWGIPEFQRPPTTIPEGGIRIHNLLSKKLL